MNRLNKSYVSIAICVFPLLLATACRTNQSPEAQVQDARIKAQVKARLASNVRPATLTNVEVNSINAVVTLSGIVNTEEEKKAIEREAKSVEGVRNVVNNLQLAREKPSTRLVDPAVRFREGSSRT